MATLVNRQQCANQSITYKRPLEPAADPHEPSLSLIIFIQQIGRRNIIHLAPQPDTHQQLIADPTEDVVAVIKQAYPSGPTCRSRAALSSDSAMPYDKLPNQPPLISPARCYELVPPYPMN
jgi:hypothetical protein